MNQVNLLFQSSLALQGIRQDAQLQRQLAQYGYDARRIKEGEKLCEDARALLEQYEEARRRSAGATLSLNEARAFIHQRYIKQLSIARIAFKGDAAAIAELGLKGEREARLDRWLKQTEDFYRQALKYVEVLHAHGIHLHELEESKTLLGQMMELSALQKQTQSRAQLLSQQKQEALILLQNWYRRLIRVARLALEDAPQQLEALGVTVRA